MINTKAKIVARCCKCGYQMCENEVWISDNMDDKSVYCFSCAPDDAIRQQDTSKAETAH